MNKKWIGATLAVLPLAIGGGLVIANSQNKGAENPTEASREAGYICPATGEELPCSNCCPLNSVEK